MNLTLKYQGQEKAQSKNETSYKETWQGSESDIDAYISSSCTVGTFVSGKGYLTSFRKYNAGGCIYNVEVEYTIQYSSSTFDNTPDTVVGQKSAQLSVRTLSMPLEAHPNYRTNWNYYFLGRGTTVIPPDYYTVKNTLIAPAWRKTYMWVKTIGEIPLEADEGKYWTILATPTKPRI